MKALTRARTLPLDRWIYAMGIPKVGESAARELARLHKDLPSLAKSKLLGELRELKTGQRKEDNPDLAPFAIAPEVGPSVAESVLGFFSSPAGTAALKHLADLNITPRSDHYDPRPNLERKTTALAGKTFVITGTLSSPRDDFKTLIMSHGGKVSGSVSKNTDYLLAGENSGSKRDKALQLGVPIISEDDLQAMLQDHSRSA
jgi:DNA ligase (NAD+)